VSNSPVALIIFNRPEHTARVFAEIARARPSRLFVIADGPRQDHPADVERCAAARAVTEWVDWGCEVHRNYADVNLGCGLRPASGISWVFEHVDEAIILEDDCLPRPSFFMFCEELLKRYRDDERVMMIGGRYHQYRMSAWSRRFQHSYAFAYSHTNWGWATWKRAWQHFDMEVRQWQELRDTRWLYDMFGDHRVVDFWSGIFDEAYAGGREAHFWDYQWTFACFARRGLAILPRTHMVTNLGFGPEATHTRRLDPERELGALLTSDMAFPLTHPPDVVRNEALDRLTSAALVDRRPRGLRSRVRRRLRGALARMRTVLR
jgi:hypothetical protein